MVVNPLCDMPEEIYKDFLADQGFDDLRHIDFGILTTGFFVENETISSYELNEIGNQFGCGVESLFEEISGLNNPNVFGFELHYDKCEPARPLCTLDKNTFLPVFIYTGSGKLLSSDVPSSFNSVKRGDGTT